MLFEDHPIFDFYIDLGKFYHDLTSNVAPPVFGCTDITTIDISPNDGITQNTGALNYNSSATVDDGSCIYCVWGCVDDTPGSFPDVFGNDSNNHPCTYPCGFGYASTNYNPLATCQDFCNTPSFGCTYQYADNYDSSANYDDGSCYWSICNDPNASNYEVLCGPNANVNYPTPWNVYPGTIWVYPNAVLGTHIIGGCTCYYQVPCTDYGSYRDGDWAPSNFQLGLNERPTDEGFWISNGGDVISGNGVYSHDITPAQLGEYWQDSSGSYLHNVIRCGSLYMTRHMDMTWLMVFNITASNTSWSSAVSQGTCFNSSWSGVNPYPPQALPDLNDPSKINLEFTGGVTPGDLDLADLDATAKMSSSIAMVQIDVPTGAQYVVEFTIDNEYSTVQSSDSAIIKLGFGNDWSVADSPISTFLEDTVNGPGGMGDLVSMNQGKQSLIEGEFVINQSSSFGGSTAPSTYQFTSLVDHSSTQGSSTPTLLVITHIGVSQDTVRIKDIKITCLGPTF